jgi:hypothetical protein
MLRKSAAFAVIIFFIAAQAVAESWPPLEDYVKDCVLIVKCRTEVKGEPIMYKVEEVWKGKYDPDMFNERPPEGYLFTLDWHGNTNPTDGREVIFFYAKPRGQSETKGKLLLHSTCFVIQDGKLIYASSAEHSSLRKEYKVEEFKSEILRIVKEQESPPDLPTKSQSSKGTDALAEKSAEKNTVQGPPRKDTGPGIGWPVIALIVGIPIVILFGWRLYAHRSKRQ